MLERQHSHSRQFNGRCANLFTGADRRRTRALSAAALLAFLSGAVGAARAQEAGQNGSPPASSNLSASFADKRCSIEAEDATLSSVLTTLMQSVGANYTLDSSLRQIRVTAHLHNLRLDTLLDILLRTATPAVTYRLEANVYRFLLRVEPTTPFAEPVNSNGSENTPSGGVRRIQVARVRFIDAAEAARLLGGIPIRASEGQTYGLVDPNKLLGLASTAPAPSASGAATGTPSGAANGQNGAAATLPANFLDYLWIVNAGAGL